MLTKLDKYKYSKQISKFYDDNYDTLDHLILSPKQVEQNNRDYYGVISGDEVIALTSIEHKTETLLEVHGTVVKQDLRNQGLGKRVNEQLEDLARENGIKKLTSSIYVDNIINIVLKLKSGYLVEGLLRNHDIRGQHEYIVSKEL